MHYGADQRAHEQNDTSFGTPSNLLQKPLSTPASHKLSCNSFRWFAAPRESVGRIVKEIRVTKNPALTYGLPSVVS
jgi:hypothetical protein